MNGEYREYMDTSLGLESLMNVFDDLVALSNFTQSMEMVSVSLEDGGPEGTQRFSDERFSGLMEGLNNKVKNSVADAGKSTADKLTSLVSDIGRGKYDLIEKAKLFLNKLSSIINTISTMINRLVVSGLPLMEGIKKQALKIKQRASDDGVIFNPSVTLPNAANYLAIDNTVAKPGEIIRGLEDILAIEKTILSKDKLNKFQGITRDTLEPYRDSIRGSKVDSVVMLMAVLSTLTNPGALVGVTLKKIFQAANPGLGNSIEKGLSVGGGIYGGVGSLVLSTGAASGTYLREMSNGRLSIRDIPRFTPIYSFCTNESDRDATSLTTTFKSARLLGNYQWAVTDYVDVLEPSIKGGVGKVGASFKQTKEDVAKGDLDGLARDEIIKICDLVIDLMANAQAYCKSWHTQAKVYNSEYHKITDIVMTYSDTDEDGKKSLTRKYVRYSYRNAMSIMLGAIWKNCFGADNTFMRYLIGLSKQLLSYCARSIA